ncbi:MAG: N-6 DNA methylase, partial [Methylococcales bacterium]|nr:N-6 DNA methylase [Methylococcales bacterium]
MPVIQTYLQDVAAHTKQGNATEHTHRPALQNLLNALLPTYHVTNEPRRIACGAPDFEIAKGVEPIGHIEAKDIGISLDKTQKSEQLVRYLASLNNLLLTDYLEFRWFVNGDYNADMTVKLADVLKNGELKPYPEEFERFETLLKTFVETQIIMLKSPEELAKKMAHIARLMNDVLLKAYEQEGEDGKLHNQLKSFREVLIDTLSVVEFVDMVAQTICYGLFAAKCSAVDAPFSRLTAVSFVPKTNPFLRQFFNQLAGIDLDERLVWMVEHLVAVLNHADMNAILADFGKRTRQEDPVVHFYETFLKSYDPDLKILRGVYYTPEPVVSYIVRSVDLVLKNQFGLRDGLADSSKLDDSTIHKVKILDPATGTGTFLHAVIAKIYECFAKNKGMWSDYVSQHLLPRVHGFELLMATYTVAHIKLSLQLKNYGYDFKSDERLRVFLTNTLDEAHGKQTTMLSEWLSDEANAASAVKRDSPVMVILGNPPYSGHSANSGAWINDLLRSAGDAANYFEVDGQSLNERNPKWLNDDYVKFIRFAHWRIMQTGYGVLAFVTNHGYLDNPTFRGMRQSLLNDFDEIYILDLHGNSKKKETALDGSVDKNVFDIQQGVAIGISIKYKNKKPSVTKIQHAHLFGERKNKYQWLSEHDIKTTEWTTLKPQAPFYLFAPQNTDLLPEYNR